MNNELVIDNLPRSIDVVKGDVLVTSGLGGRFPEGYPVAIVETV
ncbi:rod shape-determining protein MreC [Mannheimia haemolytica]|uniref:Rod shape-determining protein MreC n=1 Tax=Mannheimia haemolytica TaxID=75985 RepID=A0A378MYR3_MANHA|nr:rod shape-determining protein MreC [Mannheimia haemolytica]